MSQGIRHAPFPTFFNDIKSHRRNSEVTLTSPEARPNYEPEPLILSAVLIVKFFTCVFLRFGNSLKLNFKSYFLQFVLCQYVKDLLHLPSAMYNVQFALAMLRGE